MNSRRSYVAAALGIVIVATITTLALLRGPSIPPVADAKSGMRFIGSDDYMKLSDKARLEYAMRVIDRLKELDYDAYLALMMRPHEDRMRVMNNLRKTPGHEQVGSALFAVFLDRFWEQNPGRRTATLMAVALVQQGEIGKHPERFGLPSADQIKGEMSKFVKNQPVKTQAQCAQFLVELKRQREFMGLKEPF